MELRHKLFGQARQTIAITPRVIQSIKFLKYGHQELCEYLKEQQEKNPLVELVMPEILPTARPAERRRGGSLGTGGAGGALGGLDLPGIEETTAQSVSLREHLLQQVDVDIMGQAEKAIATEIVESIDPDGYIRRDLEEIADFLGVPLSRVEIVLAQVQGFEPTGVGARDLSECLFLQLAERGQASLPMMRLLENLPLLARHDLPALARHCGVKVQEVAAMAQILRTLDPRPGRSFESEPLMPAMPDVLAERAEDGTFTVSLNSALLPKVLVNREYYAKMRKGARGEDDVRFVTDCIKDANWLARNLDQRANTLLRVASEIVKRQQAFFVHGVEHIKPLCQGDVATTLGVHRSTVCRAISDKFVMTNRGLFELKFFFSNGFASGGETGDVSAESIRARIRQMIDGENPAKVLSDDAIMATLQADGIEIARRTVAKYREMLGLQSSSARRRQHKAARIAAQLVA